ncbi:MAG: hypothetical protein IGS38_01050 [Synechococcales cyanobacterium M58_A2018_015]|nr:hypothetical protein [Synechococcales cyanobacterium M58_A2018_015]
MKPSIVIQVSSELQHVAHWLRNISSPQQRKRLRQLSSHRNYRWLLAGVGLWLLLAWNWPLVLALAIGLLTTVLVYLRQQGQLKLPIFSEPLWQNRWQRLWQRSNRALTLSLGAGGLALLCTYGATAIWRESDHVWLATAIILEGLGILAILLLLVRQSLVGGATTQPDWLNQTVQQQLSNLSDPDPLKRLIAVRQLTAASLRSPAILPLPAAQLAECFRLQLNRETEPLVCHALLEGLQTLNPARQLSGNSRSSVAIPSRPPAKVARSVQTEG